MERETLQAGVLGGFFAATVIWFYWCLYRALNELYWWVGYRFVDPWRVRRGLPRVFSEDV